MPVKKLLNKNERVKNLWELFIIEGKIDEKDIRPIIWESWKRSKSYGINPYENHFSDCLSKKDFIKRYNKSMPLLETAKPFMESIYSTLKNDDFIIRLADDAGYILEHIGNQNLMKEHFPLGVMDAYNVSESSIGTNAAGLALITGKPIQVLGGEHYIKNFHRWTSSACPIRNVNKEIIGVLSIMGNFELVHPHTLGMIVAAAEAIEKEMIIEESNKELKHTNKKFFEIMDSISEGIIRIDNKGYIMNANRFASDSLAYNVEDIIGININKLFYNQNRKDIIEGIFKGKVYYEEEMQLKTRTGRKKTCIVNVTPIKVVRKGGKGDVVITFFENKVVHKLVNKIVGANARFTFKDILGKNERVMEAIRVASMSAKADTTILLQGESGTGKEMFAQAIHNESYRKKRPFIFLNCGAIPRELVSSELFGYEGGAFTGAKPGGHPGKFELADGGTIFLDEIGDMPLDAQTSLLRVLEDHAVVRVGGHEVIPIDVRVIAATNKNLKKEVELGKFRDDLFYRINVMPIWIPPLRNRKDDIKIFVDYFLEKFTDSTNKNIKGVGHSFYRAMLNYSWPGNVRELQNVMQMIINMADNNSVLTSKNLPNYIKFRETENKDYSDKQFFTLHEIEKNAIAKTLVSVDWNMAAAAKILGIGRSTLYRKIEKYNISMEK